MIRSQQRYAFERLYPRPAPGCVWKFGRQWWWPQAGACILRTRSTAYAEAHLHRRPAWAAEVDLVLFDHRAGSSYARVLDEVWLPSEALSLAVEPLTDWTPLRLRQKAAHGPWLAYPVERAWSELHWVASMLEGETGTSAVEKGSYCDEPAPPWQTGRVALAACGPSA
ncbi:hypothetical protein [Streptomyces purpureus]|uniref:hypothetical protein n=1 Tax=Streptomyces purpureus TaxID=1951 RepID=UPI0003703A2D|nr:hypothetical protein [Streptomyces purpureus]